MTHALKNPKAAAAPNTPRKGIVRSRAGTKSAYIGHGLDSQPPPSAPFEINTVLIKLMFRRLLLCPAGQKSEARKQIADFLKKSRNPECISELLFLCTTRGGPDGLDMAIDILSKAEGLVLEYAWEYLCRDVTAWTPDSRRSYKPNDDYWYILLRAVGRTAAGPKERFNLIILCAAAESHRHPRGRCRRPCRPGYTESKGCVEKQLSQNDEDPYIRQIASEAVADMEA